MACLNSIVSYINYYTFLWGVHAVFQTSRVDGVSKNELKKIVGCKLVSIRGLWIVRSIRFTTKRRNKVRGEI